MFAAYYAPTWTLASQSVLSASAMSAFWQRTISAWGHILVGLVRERQRARTVAHAIAVARLAGNDGGIGVAGKEADGRVRVRRIVCCALECS